MACQLSLRNVLAVAGAAILAAAPAPAIAARDLTFPERVAAQEAIERVHYSHQQGATRPFEEAVPRAVLERKVRTYLVQSAALADRLDRPVTAPMLRAEIERIARATRFPDRLREIFRALGDDPFLVQECFARPVLVERLTRGLADASHGASPLPHGAEGAHVPAVAADEPLPEVATSGCLPDDTWDNASFDDLPEPRIFHSTIWTGSEMIVWGGEVDRDFTIDLLADGFRYNPLTDTWSRMSVTGAPSPRRKHAAVWTGSRMLVWGGESNVGETNTGGSYDPATDSWSSMSVAGAPSARSGATAVWTGSEMIVWGGHLAYEAVGTGGRYNPQTGTWAPVSTVAAPAPRFEHVSVWTGTSMVVWGGVDENGPVGGGGRYNPQTNAWAPIQAASPPSPRGAPTAVWTGSRMIVWGGYDWATSHALNTGGRYDPVADSWLPTSTGGTEGRRGHSAVWTGTLMVVWGGGFGGWRYDPTTDTWTSVSEVNHPSSLGLHSGVWTGDRMIVWGGSITSTGALYDPVADSWTPMLLNSVPSERTSETAVWTGNQLIIWGGEYGGNELRSGSRYDPLLDAWSPTTTVGAPSARARHTAVWTGDEMIIFGGEGGAPWGPGGRYDPIADAWQPVATLGEPPGQVGHTAIWTGARMVVWGGTVCCPAQKERTGGRYDPATNSWSPTSEQGAPSARDSHTAVWTGDEMIVWGGSAVDSSNGGRYDPVADTWQPTNPGLAPLDRSEHSAIWDGSRMLVWGGRNFSTPLGTGGRYDPASDSWSPIATAGSPAPRRQHSAVWTGNRMLVWGGRSGVELGDGGRYDPASDLWEPIAGEGAPSPRARHSAVWTGSLMLVWGGEKGYGWFMTGGRLAYGNLADFDEDGSTVCAGDCDDFDPAAYPGAPEICDGADDDCDGAIPAVEADADGDGAPLCAGDCDDADATRFPGKIEACDNIDDDCDGTVDAFATACGLGACAAAGACTAGVDSCAPGSPSAETCNGIDDDCNGALPSGEADLDADGTSACAGDCDDADAATHPGAAEINDALDNQCAGDEGFGLVDEVSGTTGFTTPGDPSLLCWPAQGGATRYEVLRSTRADLAQGCAWQSVAGSCWVDPLAPSGGRRFHYLVRAVAPSIGSWGAHSAGSERDGDCDGFHLLDTAADDAAATSLYDFFAATPALPTDYLHVALSGTGIEAYEWCAQRADFYRAGYLDLAATGGVATSEGWDIWYRVDGGAWTGPLATLNDSYFGDQCLGAYSWCPEVLLSDHNLAASPGDGATCEARELLAGCGDGTWVFAVSVGPDRMTACGF